MQRGMADPDAVSRALAGRGEEGGGGISFPAGGTPRGGAAARDAAVGPRWKMVQSQREQAAQLLTQITVAEEREAAIVRDTARLAKDREGIRTAHFACWRGAITIEPLFALNVELQC